MKTLRRIPLSSIVVQQVIEDMSFQTIRGINVIMTTGSPDVEYD